MFFPLLFGLLIFKKKGTGLLTEIEFKTMKIFKSLVKLNMIIFRLAWNGIFPGVLTQPSMSLVVFKYNFVETKSLQTILKVYFYSLLN